MPLSLPSLPRRISGLVDVVRNMSWSWNRDARALFRDIDFKLWRRVRYDPIRLLQNVSLERLEECSSDPGFLDRYDRVINWYAGEQSASGTWFAKNFPELADRTVAYFCAEFGLHHSVPIYSGGLGVLA